MWINNNIAKPLRNGRYTTLVEWDGLGNLGEAEDQLFENGDWCYYESSRQFIRYWWAEKEDYKTISNELEKEMQEYEK